MSVLHEETDWQPAGIEAAIRKAIDAGANGAEVAMSGVEALARVLQDYGNDSRPTTQAERILADPGPLLAALAEADVLRDEWCSRNASGGGAIYATRDMARADRDEWNADPGGGVDDPPRSPVVGIERRYVTEWRPTDARA